MATTQNPPVSDAIVGAGPAGLFAAQALLAQSSMPVAWAGRPRLAEPLRRRAGGY
jgi:2-polyprenyl-6-methoxyphenol hydroxylase-like FAD-dependent oxidoreductase